MRNILRKSALKAVQKPAHKSGSLYTNTQNDVSEQLVATIYTRFTAQFLCSLLHTVRNYSHLLNLVLHSMNRPYNYNYLYIKVRKEGF
jgi:hypothetical protein